MLLNYQYHRPSNLEEVLGQLLELGQRGTVKAGGTDVFLRIKQGITQTGNLVDIGAVEDLNYITFDDERGLSIGAVTTLRTIEKSPGVIKHFSVLADAASKVGSVQIRNIGTIGGNLCQDNMCWFYNQSGLWKNTESSCFKAGGRNCHLMNDREDVCYATYRGDLAPLLIALGAEVKIQSAAKERVIPLEQLYTGNGKHPLTLNSEELLREICIPPIKGNSGSCYLKLAHRKAVDYPLVGVAGFLETDTSGIVTNAKLVMTAVDTAPVVVEEAAALIIGKHANGLVLEEIAQTAYKRAKPKQNVYHGSPKYRRRMAGMLSQRCLEQIIASLDVIGGLESETPR